MSANAHLIVYAVRLPCNSYCWLLLPLRIERQPIVCLYWFLFPIHSIYLCVQVPEYSYILHRLSQIALEPICICQMLYIEILVELRHEQPPVYRHFDYPASFVAEDYLYIDKRDRGYSIGIALMQ